MPARGRRQWCREECTFKRGLPSRIYEKLLLLVLVVLVVLLLLAYRFCCAARPEASRHETVNRVPGQESDEHRPWCRGNVCHLRRHSGDVVLPLRFRRGVQCKGEGAPKVNVFMQLSLVYKRGFSESCRRLVTRLSRRRPAALKQPLTSPSL